MDTDRYVLTLSCADRAGIVWAVADALLAVDGNIVEQAQFSDPDSGLFCLRTVFDARGGLVAARAELDHRLAEMGPDLMVRRLDDRLRVMILVSRYDHCLVDLLYRWNTGELAVDIPVVVSNHPDLAPIPERYGIPFVHLPVSASGSVTAPGKAGQEAQIARLAVDHEVDLLVLARYMQILSDDLCRTFEGRAINIHHSFLPGFKGAKPYHQAHGRGVKLVGATAHFVTADLDEGPIIEQDVARVTHAHTPEQLVRLGQDIERLVLSRAVRYVAESRVLRVGHKTVVFA